MQDQRVDHSEKTYSALRGEAVMKQVWGSTPGPQCALERGGTEADAVWRSDFSVLPPLGLPAHNLQDSETLCLLPHTQLQQLAGLQQDRDS